MFYLSILQTAAQASHEQVQGATPTAATAEMLDLPGGDWCPREAVLHPVHHGSPVVFHRTCLKMMICPWKIVLFVAMKHMDILDDLMELNHKLCSTNNWENDVIP